MLETIAGGIVDMNPRLVMKYKAFPVLALIGSALVLFLAGIPFCMSVSIAVVNFCPWHVHPFV